MGTRRQCDGRPVHLFGQRTTPCHGAYVNVQRRYSVQSWAAQDTPDTNIREMALQGANVWRVNGYIDDCGKIVAGGDKEVPFAFCCVAVLGGTAWVRTQGTGNVQR